MTLDRIVFLLESLASRSAVALRRAAFELSASICQPAAMRLLLDSIQSSPERLELIARRSFRHTNHFDKIVLLDEGVDAVFRLALNLWRPPYSSAEVEDEQIHNHRNDFWSTILFGQLESREFVRSETGELYHETLYRPARTKTGNKVNEYSPVGLVRLLSSGVQRHRGGSTYYLHHTTIHRIAISEIATSTLLLKGPHVAPATSLFSTSPWCFRRVELEPLDVTALIDRFDFVRENLPC